MKSHATEANELCEAMRKAGVPTFQDLRPVHVGKLVSLAREHGRLMLKDCNGELTETDAQRVETVETKIREIAAPLGLKVHFDGDPRGYTVKLHSEPACWNTWGGKESGYGIGETE
jgi:hypothetical protein